MLTGELLIHTRRKGRIFPKRLNTKDPALLTDAEDLLDLFGGSVGLRRGELEEVLKGFTPSGMEPKVTRGMIKLLMSKAEFEVGGEVEPRQLRSDLFDLAGLHWRKGKVLELSVWRAQALAEVGARYGLSPEEVESTMYADVLQNQILTEAPSMPPRTLLFRYNAAQIQGLLLRTERIIIRTQTRPKGQRLRQWFGYLKFFGLLYSLEGLSKKGGETEEGLELVLDGPLSLLESGTRYGMNLAQFFPVLLNWEGPWELKAKVNTKKVADQDLIISPHEDLKGFYPEKGQWIPEELARFPEAFNKLDGNWKVEPSGEILPCENNQALVPDLVFTRKDGMRCFLEYLPYPVAEKVKDRFALAGERPDYLLGVRAVPALNDIKDSRLFTFRRSLIPRLVMEFLEKTALSLSKSLS